MAGITTSVRGTAAALGNKALNSAGLSSMAGGMGLCFNRSGSAAGMFATLGINSGNGFCCCGGNAALNGFAVHIPLRIACG